MRRADLIDYAEMNFNATHGQRTAFFELPQRVGDPVRLIYVSYVVKADTEEQGCQWMHDNVLVPLAQQTTGNGYLWWRLDDCISTEVMNDGMVMIRSIDNGSVHVSSVRSVAQRRQDRTQAPADEVSRIGSRITIVPRRSSVKPGQTITVDVYVNSVRSLRTFQVAVDAVAGNGQKLELVSADTGGDRADHVFFGRNAVNAADLSQGRLGAVLFQGDADADQAKYLGSFSFASDKRTTGTYSLTLRRSDSFLNDAERGELRFSVQSATVNVGLDPSVDVIR